MDKPKARLKQWLAGKGELSSSVRVDSIPGASGKDNAPTEAEKVELAGKGELSPNEQVQRLMN